MDSAFSPHTLVKERMKGSGRSTSHKGHPSRGTTRANEQKNEVQRGLMSAIVPMLAIPWCGVNVL